MRFFEYASFVVRVVAVQSASSFISTSKYSAKNIVFDYPEARRDESVVDDYHGVKIADPYRWLEDPDSNETKEFVEAQNKIMRTYLDACPVKSDISQRLAELWNYPKYSCPFKRGDRYFIFQNSGLQNHEYLSEFSVLTIVLYVQDSLEGEPRVLLDPNTFSEDGSVSLSGTQFTNDGSTVAYSTSNSGSDWISIYFKDIVTGEDYPEVLEHIKISQVSWTKDNKGIFYSRYPVLSGEADGSETDRNADKKLYYHRLNTSYTEDVLVVEFPEEPFWTMSGVVSDSGKYLFVRVVSHKYNGNKLYFVDLAVQSNISGQLNLTPIVDNFENDFLYITCEGSVCLFLTNKDAPNYKIVKIDLDNLAQENWQTLIPEHPRDVLDTASPVDHDKLVIHYIRDVKSLLQLYSIETGDLLQTFYSDVGTVEEFSGRKDQSEIFYRITTFFSPGVIYRVDLKHKPYNPAIFKEVKVKSFDPSQYIAKQIFYSSYDGTKVPMFIISKKGLPRDGSNPALIYGYGGFNINVQPDFRLTRVIFMQHFDGVYAVPNIRGGGVYGKKWHDGGRLLNKQNVFDDFQAAAEYLIREGYTRPDLVTINGASNGGTLVAACINQRPDLYGAAVVEVGVLDMLRFHKFTVGQSWMSDFGNPENKTEFEYLLKYSPLHNIHSPENGIEYPATLVVTADHDDRVVPLHSLKFIAALQHVVRGSSQQQPLIARIETKSGHGSGKPTTSIIDESTDLLCFISQTLGLEYNKFASITCTGAS